METWKISNEANKLFLSFLGQVLFNDNQIKSIRRVLRWNNKLLFSDMGL